MYDSNHIFTLGLLSHICESRTSSYHVSAVRLESAIVVDKTDRNYWSSIMTTTAVGAYPRASSINWSRGFKIIVLKCLNSSYN